MPRGTCLRKQIGTQSNLCYNGLKRPQHDVLKNKTVQVIKLSAALRQTVVHGPWGLHVRLPKPSPAQPALLKGVPESVLVSRAIFRQTYKHEKHKRKTLSQPEMDKCLTGWHGFGRNRGYGQLGKCLNARHYSAALEHPLCRGWATPVLCSHLDTSF